MASGYSGGMAVSIWIVLSAIVLVLFYEVFLKLVRPFAGDRGLNLSFILADSFVRVMFSLLRQLGGFRFEYESIPLQDLPPRFLVIANHQSLLDIIVVMDYFGSSRRVRFVAKQELGHFMPLVSSVLRIQKHALISRKGNVHQAMDTLADFARFCARQGVNPVIFPEGTRSKNGEVGPFHSAGVRRILEEGGSLPIVALAMDGGWKVRNLQGMLRNSRGGSYRVRLVGVYESPEGKRDILRILSRAREDITKIVDEWHGAPVRKEPDREE